MHQKFFAVRSLPPIDLIRVLAMCGIFIHHLAYPKGAFPESWEVPLDFIVHAGGLGVIFFNITTGFLLALPFFGTGAQGVPDHVKFLKRRLIRILPNYYPALFFWTLLDLLFASGSTAALVWPFIAHCLFIHNLLPEINFTIVPAYWWPAMLIHFYLLFPLILRLFLRLTPAGACLLICGAGWTFVHLFTLIARQSPGYYSDWALTLLYLNLLARLPEFAMGMWLAEAWKSGDGSSRESRECLELRVPCLAAKLRSPFPSLSGPFTLFAFAALGFAFFSMLYTFTDIGLPRHIRQVAWCLVFYLFLFFLPPCRKLGSTKGIRRLAAMSYSIFLIHQPVISYSALWFGDGLQSVEIWGFHTVVVVLATYGLALVLDRASSRLRTF